MTDLILRNIRAWTGSALSDPQDIAIQNGRIAALGPDLGTQAARVIDGTGLWVSPAFVEGHLHLFAGGATLSQMNLAPVMGRDALAAAINTARSTAPPQDMLVGFGANYTILGHDRPTRHDLDALCPDRPLYITATDYHCAWANTPALQAAGILHGADPGPGAEVVMAPDGTATGELREFAAMALVKRLTPSGGREELGLSGAEPIAPTPAQRAADKTTLLAALHHCARHGITTAINMDGNLYQADLFTELAQDGLLPIRVSLPMTLTAAQTASQHGALLDRAMSPPVGPLSFGRVKMFMDGVFDTWTAVTVTDYPDRPGFRGTPLFDAETFAALCIEADRRGLSIATHAVGDGAVRRTIDGYQAAQEANGPRDRRHQIEHIDTLHPDDLPRIKALGLTASMQPVHPPGSAGLPLEPTLSIMGRARWPWAFPWAALRAADVPLVFGTDWPVSPLSPLYAIHCALSRQPWAKDDPDQRLSLADTWAAYTSTGHRVLFAERQAGSVAPGMAADLILLSGDPTALKDRPDAVTVQAVFSGGVLIWATAAQGTKG